MMAKENLKMSVPGLLVWMLIHLYCFPCCALDPRMPPHVIFILADDMGFNDVSFHGSPQIPTPNIDAIAASGIILNSYYSGPQCTPSRASLMTGRYAIYTGLQHHVIRAGEPAGLPLHMKILPQHLKDLGYSTHLVGKWHLGFCKKAYTPPYRGFDSFFGFWNGYIDYFDYTSYRKVEDSKIETIWGIDLHEDNETLHNFRGDYAMDVFTQRAVDTITQHNESQPLFLYFSSPACHVGNDFQPLQAPYERIARFKHIKNVERRIYAGMVSSLDDAVGNIFQALEKKAMLDNSIIIFTSDNGAESHGLHDGHGSNWPLKGQKFHLWEGGNRVPAVIWSPLLKLEQPRTSSQLMHISDWLPTLYFAAGGNITHLGVIDGKNMWPSFVNDLVSPRTEMLYNIDNQRGISALREGDYKLVNGTYSADKDFWYGQYKGDEINITSLDDWVWRNGSLVKDILERSGLWLPKSPDVWRQNASVNCGSKSPSAAGMTGGCNATEEPCLFNIVHDPCEYENLASHYPKIVAAMWNRIQELAAEAVDSLSKPVDPRADPKCHGFTYVTWLDDEYSSECPWLE